MSSTSLNTTDIPVRQFYSAKQTLIDKVAQHIKDPLFPLPLDICGKIFCLLDIRDYTACYSVSHSWKQHVTDDAFDIFKLAALCLDIKIPDETKWESKPTGSIYPVALNNKIFELKFYTKTTKLFIKSEYATAKKIKHIDSELLLLGFNAHLLLSRIELSSWEQIHYCANYLSPIIDVGKNKIPSNIFEEFIIQNLVDEAIQLFENKLLTILQPGELEEAGKKIIFNLCKQAQFTQASEFFERNYSDADQNVISSVLSIILAHAILNNKPEQFEKLILYFFQDHKLLQTLTLLLNACKSNQTEKLDLPIVFFRDNYSERKFRKMLAEAIEIMLDITVKTEQYNFIEKLILFLYKDKTLLTKLINLIDKCKRIDKKKSNQLFLKHFELLSKGLLINLGAQEFQDPEFEICKNILNLISSNSSPSLFEKLTEHYKNLTDKKINCIIQRLLSIEDSKTLREQLLDLLIKQCTNIEYETVSIACSFPSLPAEMHLALITKCSETNNFNEVFWLAVYNLLDRRIRLLIIDKCKLINSQDLYKAFKEQLSDETILKLIEKLDVETKITLDNPPWEFPLELTITKLETMAKMRSRHIVKALNKRYSSHCLIM